MVRPMYEYQLELSSITGIGERDENGDYVESNEVFAVIGKCRHEANSKGEKMDGVDGSTIFFSWIIYGPKKLPDLSYGQRIRVVDVEGKILASGSVKRFHRGYYNCRIWL